MAGRTISTRLSLDGADQFKKNLASINSELKISQAEFKTLSASYNSSAKSAEGLSAQQKNLQEQVRLNQERVKGLSSAVEGSAKTYAEAQKELEKMVATHGRESDEAVDAAKELRSAEIAMDRYRKQLASAENDLNKSTFALSKFNEENGKTKIGQAFTAGKASVEEFKDKIESVKKALSPVTDEIGKIAKGAGAISFKAAETSAKAFTSTVSGGMKAAAAATEQYAKALTTTLTAAIGTAVTAVSTLTVKSVTQYGELEQLAGGISRLYGESSDLLRESANDAFNTVGISANEYLQTVTGFSAALIKSLGGDTKAASEVADRAMKDIADNANTFGKYTVTELSNVYQSLAKGQYNTLDNLMLGYAGTKEGMQQLIHDASQMTSIQKELNIAVNDGDMSFANMVNAISVVQKQMGIMGTTQNEAAHTIQGSVSAMKASWKNLVTGLADENADLKKLTENFTNSFATAANNIIPRIKIALKGANSLIKEMVPIIVREVPGLLKDMGPGLITVSVQLVRDAAAYVSRAIPTFINDILPKLITELNAKLPAVLNGITSGFNDLVLAAADIIIKLLPIAVSVIIPELVGATTELIGSLIDRLPEMIPIVAEGAATLFQGLIDGLNDTVDKLIPLLPGIVIELSDALINNAPEFFESSLEFFAKIIEALASITKELLPKLPELITKLCDTLIEHIDEIFDAGFELLIALADGLIACIPTLLEKIPQIIGKLVETFTNKENLKKLLETGVRLISELARGIPQAVGEIAENVPVITQAIVDTIMETDWLQVGKDILEGILSGLLDIDFDAEEFLDEFADNFVTGIKDIFGIHSPSKLMRDEIGKNLALGIGQGFEETMRAETIKMTKAIPTDFDTDVNMRRAEISWSRADIQKAGDVNYYVPVYVTISGDLSENSGRYRRIAEGIAKETQMQLAGMGLK